MENPTKSDARPRYEAPSILTYSSEEILNEVGPAQGYGTAPVGVDDDSSS